MVYFSSLLYFSSAAIESYQGLTHSPQENSPPYTYLKALKLDESEPPGFVRISIADKQNTSNTASLCSSGLNLGIAILNDRIRELESALEEHFLIDCFREAAEEQKLTGRSISNIAGAVISEGEGRWMGKMASDGNLGPWSGAFEAFHALGKVCHKALSKLAMFVWSNERTYHSTSPILFAAPSSIWITLLRVCYSDVWRSRSYCHGRVV